MTDANTILLLFYFILFIVFGFCDVEWAPCTKDVITGNDAAVLQSP